MPLNPNECFPIANTDSICFIKNTIKKPNIIVGDYTYYLDSNDASNLESHVTHHYDFIGDKLIMGKFCAIAQGIEFVMNGAIIGANSVVASKVPPNHIYAGNPENP